MRSSWYKMSYSTARSTRQSQPPPEPRPYKSIPAEQKPSKHPDQPEPPSPAAKGGFLSALWPRRSPSLPRLNTGPQDPARGIEATRRVVKEGVLDPRYRPVARRVTALMCGLTLSIGLGYELFQRRFMGRERKRHHAPPTAMSEEQQP